MLDLGMSTLKGTANFHAFRDSVEKWPHNHCAMYVGAGDAKRVASLLPGAKLSGVGPG